MKAELFSSQIIYPGQLSLNSTARQKEIQWINKENQIII